MAPSDVAVAVELCERKKTQGFQLVMEIFMESGSVVPIEGLKRIFINLQVHNHQGFLVFDFYFFTIS